MPVAVISTTGTSVFSQASKPIQEAWQSFRQQPGIDLTRISQGSQNFAGYELYQRVLEFLRAEALSAEAETTLRKASAELNSLSHILGNTSRERNDELHFLSSYTPDGVLAARIVADFAGEYFGINTSRVHLITGLQVDDGRRFQADGIRHLIGAIYGILKEAPAGTFTRVINPTGGFKGVVPYLTLIGMVEQDIEISYIYERSTELIRLGRIPLQFDFEVLESAYPALEKCAEGFASAAELKSLLGLDATQPLTSHAAWSLFDQTEQDGEPFYLVNGLGEIVRQHFAGLRRARIYLSRLAAERFDALDRNQQVRFARHFEALRNPAWLDQKRHDEYGNPGGAICVKPGNVDERLWCYHLEGDDILVAELAFHRPGGDYDRVPQRRKDYDMYRLWESK